MLLSCEEGHGLTYPVAQHHDTLRRRSSRPSVRHETLDACLERCVGERDLVSIDARRDCRDDDVDARQRCNQLMFGSLEVDGHDLDAAILQLDDGWLVNRTGPGEGGDFLPRQSV